MNKHLLLILIIMFANSSKAQFVNISGLLPFDQVFDYKEYAFRETMYLESFKFERLWSYVVKNKIEKIVIITLDGDDTTNIEKWEINSNSHLMVYTNDYKNNYSEQCTYYLKDSKIEFIEHVISENGVITKTNVNYFYDKKGLMEFAIQTDNETGDTISYEKLLYIDDMLIKIEKINYDSTIIAATLCYFKYYANQICESYTFKIMDEDSLLYKDNGVWLYEINRNRNIINIRYVTQYGDTSITDRFYYEDSFIHKDNYYNEEINSSEVYYLKNGKIVCYSAIGLDFSLSRLFIQKEIQRNFLGQVIYLSVHSYRLGSNTSFRPKKCILENTYTYIEYLYAN